MNMWFPSTAAAVLAAALPIVACGTATPRDSGDLTPAPSLSPADSSSPRTAAQRGAKFVALRGCPSCHQSKDPNDGVLSGQSAPRPGTMAYAPNLTPDPDTGLGGWSDENILRAVRTGVDDQGAPLCPPMPHFGDLGDEEANDILAYLRGLPPIKRKAPDSQCPGKEGTDDAGMDDAGDSSTHVDAGPGDAGCAGFAAPTAPSGCQGCGTHTCQANGCYGGYWCNAATNKCHPKPASCP